MTFSEAFVLLRESASLHPSPGLRLIWCLCLDGGGRELSQGEAALIGRAVTQAGEAAGGECDSGPTPVSHSPSSAWALTPSHSAHL